MAGTVAGLRLGGKSRECSAVRTRCVIYGKYLLSIIELDKVAFAAKVSDSMELIIARGRAVEYEGASRSRLCGASGV